MTRQQPSEPRQIAILVAGPSPERAEEWARLFLQAAPSFLAKTACSLDELREQIHARDWDLILAPNRVAPVSVATITKLLEAEGINIPVADVDDYIAQRLSQSAKETHHGTATAFAAHASAELPAIVFMADASGRITFLNERWRELAGAPEGSDLHLAWQSRIHPDDLPGCRAGLMDACRNAKECTRDFRVLSKQGHYHLIRGTAIPQRDKNGVLTGIIASCMDITDRRDHEEQLRDQERLVQAVANATQLLLTGTVADGPTCAGAALKTLGEAMQVDRTYIFSIWKHAQTGEMFANQEYEWCKKGITPQIDNEALQSIPLTPIFPALLRAMLAGTTFKGIVNKLPQEAREFLAAQQIRSLMIAPIFIGKELWGLLGFDDCQTERVWAPNEEQALRTMASNFSALFARHQTETLLQFHGQLLHGISKATQELLVTPDLDAALQRALGALGTAADVRRVYLFEAAVSGRGEHSLQIRALWRLSATEQQDDGLVARLAPEELPESWYDGLLAGQSISGIVLDLLKRASPSQPAELRNILLVPVMTGPTFWGVLGFDKNDLNFKWTTSDKNLLTAAAGSIGTAIARHEAETALRASEEYYRSLIDNVSDVITVLDMHGTIAYLSAATERALGYLPTELTGHDAASLLHPDDAYSLAQVRRILAENPSAIRMAEFRLRHRDGTWRDFECAAKLLRTTSGSRHYVINARDVTERKQTESALRRSQELLLHSQKMEAMGQLAGGIAHDFNNLLTAIRGYTELLLEQLPIRNTMRAELDEILRAAERAHNLTRQLLAFSRRQVLEPRLVDINIVVLDIEKMLGRIIGENIALTTVLEPDLGLIRVDVGQVEQMITNLAVNARDAMPNGGRLTIRTERVDITERLARDPFFVEPNSYICLHVQDNGRGIPPEVIKRIFEPFFTTKDVGKGTGLGLSMVYGIVEQSGGAILVESLPGNGTTFSIYLPRVEGHLHEGDRQPKQLSPSGSETILLVEDEEAVRTLTAKLLTRQGYTVVLARDGREALSVAENSGYQFDLLLTDIVLPYVNGTSLAEQLRAKKPDLRVIYMSGYAREALTGSSDVVPGKNFVAKPFRPDVLMRCLREVLDAR